MKLSARVCLFLAAAAALPTAANATVTINVNQVGGDVVATLSGALDVTGLTKVEGPIALAGGVEGDIAYLGIGPDDFPMDAYSGLAGPANFGTGSYILSSSSLGDVFALNGGADTIPWVFLPQGYVSGSVLSGSAIWNGTTLALLGLAPGQYIYGGEGLDSVIVNIVGSVGGVPEPGTWAMMLVGFGAIGFAMRRNRKQVPQIA